MKMSSRLGIAVLVLRLVRVGRLKLRPQFGDLRVLASHQRRHHTNGSVRVVLDGTPLARGQALSYEAIISSVVY